MAHVIAGNRHERPAECSPAIYELLCSCWAADPLERPSFVTLVGVLGQKFQELNAIMSLPSIAPRSALNGATAAAMTQSSQQDVNPYEYSEAVATLVSSAGRSVPASGDRLGKGTNSDGYGGNANAFEALTDRTHSSLYGRGITQETAYGHSYSNSYPAPSRDPNPYGEACYVPASRIPTDTLLRPTMYEIGARARDREATAATLSEQQAHLATKVCLQETNV